MFTAIAGWVIWSKIGGWLNPIRPFLPYVAGVAAILLALWWIDRSGYQRAQADQEARANFEYAVQARMLVRVERNLAQTIAAIDGTVAEQIAGIEAVQIQLQPIIEREIIREKRLTDPAAGLTPGLLDAINRARATGACASTSDGGIVCALSAAEAGS